jgi:hypothetical protein
MLCEIERSQVECVCMKCGHNVGWKDRSHERFRHIGLRCIVPLGPVCDSGLARGRLRVSGVSPGHYGAGFGFGWGGRNGSWGGNEAAFLSGLDNVSIK